MTDRGNIPAEVMGDAAVRELFVFTAGKPLERDFSPLLLYGLRPASGFAHSDSRHTYAMICASVGRFRAGV